MEGSDAEAGGGWTLQSRCKPDTSRVYIVAGGPTTYYNIQSVDSNQAKKKIGEKWICERLVLFSLLWTDIFRHGKYLFTVILVPGALIIYPLPFFFAPAEGKAENEDNRSFA